jgi:2,3-bisphosphoglycerate-dependent phosphoglycerate mutase
MELYIIRHGQSANNVLDDETLRTYDPPLTDLGKRQAERLAEYLTSTRELGLSRGGGAVSSNGANEASSRGFTHLYCSAMHRALQTAAPVAQALGIQPEVWIDIHEQGGIYLDEAHGRVGYPGKTRPEILGEFPDYRLPEAITERGWYNAERGYEEMYMGAGRAIKVAMELRRRAAGDDKQARIAIVTHGTFIDLLLKAFLGLLPNRKFYFSHSNTAMSRLDFFENDLAILRYTNRTEHLPSDMIS